MTQVDDPVVFLVDTERVTQLIREADDIANDPERGDGDVEEFGDTEGVIAALHPDSFHPVLSAEGPIGPHAEWTLDIAIRVNEDFEGPGAETPEGEKFSMITIICSGASFHSLPSGPVADNFDWLGSAHPRIADATA